MLEITEVIDEANQKIKEGKSKLNSCTSDEKYTMVCEPVAWLFREAYDLLIPCWETSPDSVPRESIDNAIFDAIYCFIESGMESEAHRIADQARDFIVMSNHPYATIARSLISKMEDNIVLVFTPKS